MTERISAVQLFILLLTGKLAGMILYPEAFVDSEAVFSFLPAVILYASAVYVIIIPSCNRNKKLHSVSGGYSGRWLSSVFSLYFLYMVFLRLYRFFKFSQLNASEGLSPLLITLFILTAALYAAISGAEAVARFSGFVFFSMIVCSVPLIFLLFQSYDAGSLDNICNVTSEDTLSGFRKIISESDDLALMFILSPFVVGNFKRSAMVWNTFTLVSLLFFLILIGGSVTEYIKGTAFPLYRITDSASFLQRTAPVFVMIFIFCFICLISAELFVVMKLPDYFAFSGKNIKIYRIIVSAVIYGGALLIINFSGLRNVLFSEKVRSIITPLFSFIIPLISFVVLILKKERKEHN